MQAFLCAKKRVSVAYLKIPDAEVAAAIKRIVFQYALAWHILRYGKYGITNSNSVGVEFCVNVDSDRTETLRRTAQLVRELMSELNIPIERVVRHFDASRKNCPASMSANNWMEWYKFKEMLKGDSLTMSQYEELKNRIDEMSANLTNIVNDMDKKLERLANPMIYNYIDDI